MPLNEKRFWEMVSDLLRLDQGQSEALFEKLLVLDIMSGNDEKYRI